MYRHKLSSAIAGLLFVVVFSASAEEPTSVYDAVANGDANLAFRYRVEQVDQDGLTGTAFASTLRTRINYKTSSYKGFLVFVEADDITYVGDDHFNSTRNGKTMYPVIADPSGTGVNQAYLRYSNDAFALTAGRQRINRDNQRFVGGVGWRQNEQTYDAFDINYQRDSLNASYSYVTRVARVFGPDAGSPSPTFDSDTSLANLKYEFGGAGTLSAYAYLLDFENAATSSTRTIGARYTAGFDAGAFRIPVMVEYSDQSDYSNNPLDYSASYLAAEVGLEHQGIGVRLGNEVLEGTASGVFVTPLATLHKFQGWADKFLATPANGIDDRYLTGSAGFSGFNFVFTYHQFKADLGSADYGDEIDVSVGKKVGEHFDVLLKAAQYNADTFATDTTKVWLMVTATF